MTERPLTILFMPESAYGPTNQCIGIGNVLRRRGHRVVFAAEASWRGKLERARLRGGPRRPRPAGGRRRRTPSRTPAQFWKDFIRDTAPEFRKPTVEQLETFMQPTWQALIDGARYCEPQLREILDRVRPDVVVEDNVVALPGADDRGRAVRTDHVVQPARGARSRASPPAFSGLPADDRAEWAAFRAEYDRTHREMWSAFNAWVVEQGAPTAARPRVHPHVASTRTSTSSPRRPTTPTRARSTRPGTGWTPACARPTSSTSSPRSCGPPRGQRARLPVARLARQRRRRPDAAAGRRARPHAAPLHREQGPQAREYDLADNMVGAEFLPQTTLIPQVDARHHPRRQQHDDRGAALRQADGAAAAVLGPVRQRAADGRARLRGAARDLRVHRGARCAARSRTVLGRREAGRARGRSARASARATGCAAAPTSSSGSRPRASPPGQRVGVTARDELAAGRGGPGSLVLPAGDRRASSTSRPRSHCSMRWSWARVAGSRSWSTRTATAGPCR